MTSTEEEMIPWEHFSPLLARATSTYLEQVYPTTPSNSISEVEYPEIGDNEATNIEIARERANRLYEAATVHAKALTSVDEATIAAGLVYRLLTRGGKILDDGFIPGAGWSMFVNLWDKEKSK